MRFPAPRLGASALVLASLAAGIATIAATSPVPPAPQTGPPLAAAPVTAAPAPPLTTTPVPPPTTALEPAAPAAPRSASAAPPPSPGAEPPPRPAPAPPPRPGPPVIEAQTARPATINLKGCGGARAEITVRLAEPAASVTLHVTGPGGVTRNRAMNGGGAVWTDALGPYEVTGTATWSVTARNAAGDTHGELKTVKVVAC